MVAKADSTPVSPETPRCAVIVSTRNRGAKIAPLVESVLKNREPEFEMVVVDQSDGLDTEAAMQPFLADRRLRFVRSDRKGTSRGRNLGAAMTSAPLLVITDDDCIVPEDWLTRMLRPFDENPRVGVAFCTVDPVPVEGPGLTPSIHFERSRTVGSLGEAWIEARRKLALGAGMAIRRTAFVEVQGFDEVLGPGSTFPACEDNDLAWRALVKGWQVYENADVVVLHDGFRTLEQVRALVSRDCFGAGGAMAKYLRSGHWRMAPVIAFWIYRLGIRGPAEDLLALRSPRGFRRPYWLLQGLAKGLLTPLEEGTLRYAHPDSDTVRK